MNFNPLFEICVNGHVSTNSGRERIDDWRKSLERRFASLDLVMLQEKKLSVEIKFWLSYRRISGLQKNDLDNLAKPILDAMKRIGLIIDDAMIFHLDVSKFPTNADEGVYIRVREWR